MVSLDAGVPKTARKDGDRDLPQPNEFLRNDACWEDSQPLFQVCFFRPHPDHRVWTRSLSVQCLCSDIYRIDEVLARTFNMLFVNTARSLFTLAVISVSTPPFAILIVPLGALYLYIQRYYLRTSRELKRLDSITKSPIYAHFQESLGGITTIRAYRQQKRFALENEWRMDANLRV
jgi:ATP-binding cassette subfamily C (CFTR/MRP) protein 1